MSRQHRRPRQAKKNAIESRRLRWFMWHLRMGLQKFLVIFSLAYGLYWLASSHLFENLKPEDLLLPVFGMAAAYTGLFVNEEFKAFPLEAEKN